MKILYVTTVSNTINAFLISHIKMLIEEGNTVDIAFNIDQEIKPEIKDLGCKVHLIPFQRSPLRADNIKAYKLIKHIMSKEKYDLIHTHTPIASVVTRLASRTLEKTKIIYTAHGFHFYKGSPLKNWIIYYPIEKLLAKYTDVLITINEEDYRTAVNNNFKAKSIELVEGVGINLDKFSPQTQMIKEKLRNQYGFSKNDYILIYAGELSYRKHQDLLVTVASKLKNKIPNLKILLAGTGQLKETYEKQIKELGIEEHVKLLGFRSDIDKLMALSDVAVSASRQEGLPVNIMEAMATGLPLVVTNCRGNRDLVSTEENGFIVGINEEDRFVESLEKIYLSENLRNEFSQQSLSKVQEYSMQNVLMKMKCIYIKTMMSNKDKLTEDHDLRRFNETR